MNDPNNIKLTYCNEKTIKCVRHFYILIKKCLEIYPNIDSLKKKIIIVLMKYVDLSFIICQMHIEMYRKLF